MIDIWKTIVQIHQEAKSLMLLAEELDAKFCTFIQPVREYQAALEHIVRAKAVELDVVSSPNGLKKSDYSGTSYDKALGHEYRAFFDVADWLSMSIREKVIELMEPYSREAISSVVPSYYKDWRPSIEKTSKAIASIRDSKDISSRGTILEEVRKYKSEIDKLLDIYNELLACVPGLEEYSKKERNSSRKNIILKILIPIVAAIVGTVIGAVLTK